MRYIADWQNKNLRCHYCGETRSVKYEEEILDPTTNDKHIRVCVCNKCALLKPQVIVTAQKETR